MISRNEIQSLVNLLLERNVSLYHACQLIDFESYLALGGIPSRDSKTKNCHLRLLKLILLTSKWGMG